MSELPLIPMDFETRSGAPLRKTGAYRYANDETTEIMMLAAKFPKKDTGLWYSREVDAPAALGPVLKSGPNKGKQRVYEEAIDLYRGDDMLQELFYAIKNGCHLEAHNMMFEWAIWHAIMVPKYGAPKLDQRQVRCSAAKAAAYALPRSLEGAGAALDLAIQKDKEGSKLLQRLCKMRKPTKDNPRIWFGDQAEIERLGAYCVTDVDSEHAISNALPDLPASEWELWFVDQAMNERGISLDVPLIEHCKGLAADAKVELNKELNRLTGIEKASQRKAVIQWLNEEGGVDIDNTRGATLDALVEEAHIDPDVHRVIQITREVNKTTTAKYDAMLTRVDADGRARDNLMFNAASTGRWAGRGIQLQNLKRGSVKNMDAECDMIAQCDIGLLLDITKNPIDALSGVIRGMIVPKEGHDFVVADYSSIEARGTMWLGEDEDALNIFRSGADIYCEMASDIYGIPINKHDHPDERQLGKQAILGLGYGMGPGKFLITCRGYGIEFPEELIARIMTRKERDDMKELLLDKWHMYGRSEDITKADIEELVLAKFIVDRYRTKYSAVTALWKSLEDAAIAALRDSVNGIKRWVPAANGRIHYKKIGTFLACRLPSGRMLWYPSATLKKKEAPWSKPGEEKAYIDSIRYMGVDNTTRQWTKQWTYGGKLCENVVQGLSRDLMGNAMIKVERHPIYTPVLTVHDEIISEVETGRGSVHDFEALICELPDWGEGFPLKAEGERLKRYKK